MFALLLTGCQTNSIETIQEEGKQMSQEEEKQLKEKAIKYIKEKYNKDFEVSEVSKGQAAGLIRVRGKVKDGKDTEVTVIWEKDNEIKDTYVIALWRQELSPKITSMLNKYMDVRRIESISYSNGKRYHKYSGEVPSVFEVLKNGGDKDFTLVITARIYNDNGQYESGLKNFLKEAQSMNFNKVMMEVFVADDELKSAPEDVKESSYTLYRYNIVIDDIQKVDIDNLDLDQYKTVIKE
jgi:hypothetical protein